MDEFENRHLYLKKSDTLEKFDLGLTSEYLNIVS